MDLVVASVALGAWFPLHDGRPLLIDFAGFRSWWIGLFGPATQLPTSGQVAGLHAAMTVSLIVFGGLIAFFGFQLSRSFLIPVMADSARMLSPNPENLPARDHIRKRGMELLEALHASDRGYDRIVWVSHSLGTIVSYGVLAQYWGNVYRLFDHSASKAEREAVEAAAIALNKAPESKWPGLRKDYRTAVRAYFAALSAETSGLPQDSDVWRTAEYTSTNQLVRMVLGAVRQLKRRRGKRETPEYRSAWRVSDFITLGSPLTYASLLTATSHADFCEQIETRRNPTCPPRMKSDETFCYNGEPHHAALFAATCWTNLFFETIGLVKGDIIGGAVAGDPPHGLGRGVMDVAVLREEGMPKFAHNHYWKMPKREDAVTRPAEHIQALRAAINLFSEPPGEVDERLNRLAPPRTRRWFWQRRVRGPQPAPSANP
jgi:hypothetical protein